MREFSIILPKTDNEGRSTGPAHYNLQQALKAHFGGFTIEDVTGVWINPEGQQFEDQSNRYTVAVVDSPSMLILIRALAETAGQDARQETVYLRHPSGEVELIEAVLPLVEPVDPN